MFILDQSKSETIQLSNDAFYYLLNEEEPLDEANLDEAKEVLSLFPNGFVIADDYTAISGTDLIEATFIPYVQDKHTYDLVYTLCKDQELQLTWLNKKRAEVWWVNYEKGTRVMYGTFDICTNKFGLDYFSKRYEHGESICYLNRFKKPTSDKASRL